jgi:acetyl esterase/lipase
VLFTASLSEDPDGSVVAAEWDFGDLTQGAGRDVTHLYAAAGTYTVTLAVADDRGAVGVASTSITVDLPGPPEPPRQPPIGPGGSDYTHASVNETETGAGATKYWLFEPADPTPTTAPLVVFVHGFSAVDPAPYRAWIEHLARRGNIVLFPAYQTLLTLPTQFTPNTITAIQSGITLLRSGGHVEPELDKVAIAGHSYGGIIAANVAATAAINGLPVMRAVLCAEPGSAGIGPYADYSQIPAGTLLLAIVGDEDLVVGDAEAKKIHAEAVQVAASDKDFIRIFSDGYGDPDLAADHSAPLAGPLFPADALDWYGFWKWLDALTDAAFYGENRDHALGDTPEQRFLGNWSDGTAVLEAEVTDSP